MRYRVLPALVGAAALCMTHSAYAATFSVDDDHADCPAAQFSSIQAAVDAAAPGDTVTICPGNYAEGSGQPGTNALTITKDLTLKGAGADLVKITPVSSVPVGGRIMESQPDIRNGVGDIIAVDGTPSQPLDVSIQGVTVDGWDPAGRPVVVEAGIVFLDARGEVLRSRVTDIVTSEGNNAYQHPGGWRGSQPGIGIAQTSTALYSPVDGARQLRIDHTRIDKYNQIGVLIDGAQNDVPPLTASGTIDWGVITASQIVGRTECIEFQGTGNCSSVGLLTTGPLFGQDGLRVTSSSYATVDSSLISQNLVNGAGAPTRNSTDNNANLTLAAGARYIAAQLGKFSGSTNQVILSQITHSNITDNAYGALNLQADGVTAATGNPNATIFQNFNNLLKAEGNWWGLRDQAATNPGPAISPATNPAAPESPVNGTATTETVTGGTTSNAVDFYPYRDGNAANPATGEYPVLTAPIPMSDAAPTVSLSAPATAAPGSTFALTAVADDDFGVKRVRFADGATSLGIATLPPYTQSVSVPSDAVCDSTHTYSAVAMDSLGQTAASQPVTVKVACPAPAPPTTNPSPAPAAPTIAWRSWPSPLKGSGAVSFAPAAAAGLQSVAVFLGDRQACAATAQPWSCTVHATGADVGGQSLRLVATDALGRTAELQRSISVAKFASALKLSVAKHVSGAKATRTISGRLTFPSAVTKQQGCSGTVTLVVRRAGHSVLNEQVPVSKTCTFKRSLTAGRKAQSFSAGARYGGNAVLTTANETRRFS